MLVYKNYLVFKILGEEVNIISDETAYGRNTVVEMKNVYHYMGEEFPGVAAAIFAWQEVNGRDLTNEELHQIMSDNNFISQGI
jgi:hypothetical protein